MMPYRSFNYRVYCWFKLVVVGEERDVDTGKRTTSFPVSLTLGTRLEKEEVYFFALLYSSRIFHSYLIFTHQRYI